MIIKGKHTDYTYNGDSVIIATTDMGYDCKQEYITLTKASSNPLSVLRVVMDYERYYA